MKSQMAMCTLILTFGVSLAHADDKATVAPAMTAEQKAIMEAYERVGEVRAEQKQLAYFVGNWTNETSMWMDPKAAPEKTTGISKGEAVYGGRYYRLKNEGTTMGQPYSGEGLLGFDNLKGKFFNTWMDSMSTGAWLVYGSYDAAKKTYTFHGDMDDPLKTGAKIPVRETIRIVDNAHYSFEWWETRAGKETKTLQIDYTRQ